MYSHIESASIRIKHNDLDHVHLMSEPYVINLTSIRHRRSEIQPFSSFFLVQSGMSEFNKLVGDKPLSAADESRLVFRVEIKNMRATDLKCRHRFKEKLRTRVYFDDRRFKSDKEQVGMLKISIIYRCSSFSCFHYLNFLLGGGDVTWKNVFSFEWQLSSEHTSSFILDIVKTQLEQRCLKIEVLCQHDEKTTGTPLGTSSSLLFTLFCINNINSCIGSCMVDLYTLATGPVDHNLPLQVIFHSSILTFHHICHHKCDDF